MVSARTQALRGFRRPEAGLPNAVLDPDRRMLLAIRGTSERRKRVSHRRVGRRVSHGVVDLGAQGRVTVARVEGQLVIRRRREGLIAARRIRWGFSHGVACINPMRRVVSVRSRIHRTHPAASRRWCPCYTRMGNGRADQDPEEAPHRSTLYTDYAQTRFAKIERREPPLAPTSRYLGSHARPSRGRRRHRQTSVGGGATTVILSKPNVCLTGQGCGPSLKFPCGGSDLVVITTIYRKKMPCASSSLEQSEPFPGRSQAPYCLCPLPYRRSWSLRGRGQIPREGAETVRRAPAPVPVGHACRLDVLPSARVSPLRRLDHSAHS